MSATNAAPVRRGRGRRVHVPDGYVGRLVQLAVGLLLFATLFIGNPEASAGRLTARIAPADYLLALLTLLALFRLALYGLGQFESILRYFIPSVAVYVGVNALFSLVTDDSGTELLINSFSLFFFIVPLALMFVPLLPRDLRWLTWSVVATVAYFVVFSLLPSVGSEATGNAARYDASGLFVNPNHSASWALIALFIVGFALPIRVPLRIALAVGLIYLMLQVSSFAAVLGLLVGLTYILFSYAKTIEQRVLLICGMVLAIPFFAVVQRIVAAVSPRLQASEAEKSSEGREALWGQAWSAFLERPLGRGVDGAIDAVGREIHNEFLTALVAFGFLGILILGVVGWSLWKIGGRTTHAIVLAMAVDGFFHNVWSWRHMWVMLAIAVIYDVSAKRAQEQAEAEETDTAEPAAPGKPPGPRRRIPHAAYRAYGPRPLPGPPTPSPQMSGPPIARPTVYPPTAAPGMGNPGT